jgi:SAM-dependent methyltransferase
VRPSGNVDPAVVAGFGDEWSRFDQSALDPAELAELASQYFAAFPWESLPSAAVGLDLGCGSGRWARVVAPRVGTLHCVDPSAEALAVARRNLRDLTNVVFHQAGVDAIPVPDGSLDFAYSLGVLHHVPDTAGGLASLAAKLKPGAPLLVYLYYAFENRPAWFRAVWRASELLRFGISRTPHVVRFVLSQVIAAGVYWPLARLARLGERVGLDVRHLPLSAYRDRSFYVMRTDALDRFGTRLERRFSRTTIARMLEEAGLEDVRFSQRPPFWCAVGMRQGGGTRAVE